MIGICWRISGAGMELSIDYEPWLLLLFATSLLGLSEMVLTGSVFNYTVRPYDSRTGTKD